MEGTTGRYASRVSAIGKRLKIEVVDVARTGGTDVPLHPAAVPIILIDTNVYAYMLTVLCLQTYIHRCGDRTKSEIFTFLVHAEIQEELQPHKSLKKNETELKLTLLNILRKVLGGPRSRKHSAKIMSSTGVIFFASQRLWIRHTTEGESRAGEWLKAHSVTSNKFCSAMNERLTP